MLIEIVNPTDKTSFGGSTALSSSRISSRGTKLPSRESYSSLCLVYGAALWSGFHGGGLTFFPLALSLAWLSPRRWDIFLNVHGSCHDSISDGKFSVTLIFLNFALVWFEIWNWTTLMGIKWIFNLDGILFVSWLQRCLIKNWRWLSKIWVEC